MDRTTPTLNALPQCRPDITQRTFNSKLVEEHISNTLPRIKHPDLATLFENCYPRTLDTTVFEYVLDLDQSNHAKSQPRTYIITGDIPAMWLRDSTNQVLPYLPLLRSSDPASSSWIHLYRLLLGLVYAQADCINLHAFSNAFIPPHSTIVPGNKDSVHPPPPSGHRHPEQDAADERHRRQRRTSTPRVWESKYELDSLASFLDLSCKLHESSGRTDFVNHDTWRKAVRKVLIVCELQQRGTQEEVDLLSTPWWGPTPHSASPPALTGHQEKVSISSDEFDWKGSLGVYRFHRPTTLASETRSLGGLGEPAKRCGLIKSAFRPSDDSTVLPFLIPSNAYISVTLKKLSNILSNTTKTTTATSSSEPNYEIQELAKRMKEIGEQVEAAVWREGVVSVDVDGTGRFERVFAYEVDGYGSFVTADDSNAPSLLSLPTIDFVASTNPVYESTRKLILSKKNKWYFEGKAARGIGGMHVGFNFVWPMSIIVQALTSNDDDEEILDCLHTLKNTTAATGLIHESFHVDDPHNFTRPHFAWACGLFGQLVLHVLDSNPYLLQ